MVCLGYHTHVTWPVFNLIIPHPITSLLSIFLPLDWLICLQFHGFTKHPISNLVGPFQKKKKRNLVGPSLALSRHYDLTLHSLTLHFSKKTSWSSQSDGSAFPEPHQSPDPPIRRPIFFHPFYTRQRVSGKSPPPPNIYTLSLSISIAILS